MISPPASEKLNKFSFLFDGIQKQMGFVPGSLKAMSRVPAILGSFCILSSSILGDPNKVKTSIGLKLSMKNLGWMAKHMKNKERLPMHLKNLVSHVVSNAAGCRYCQAHTIGEAKLHGANDRQLYEVWQFESSDAFSDAEKAALRFALASAQIPNAVTEEHFTTLRKFYSEENIIELGATVSLFGFLNRWNDTFATQLEKTAIISAEKYLSPSGWEIGKHA